MTAKLKLFLNARFTKLPRSIDSDITELIGMCITNFEDLSPKFVNSDTEILPGEHYPLPTKGKCIVLTLLSHNTKTMNLWYDIRRWTHKREKMYNKHMNRVIRVIIKNKT